ncbi:MAG TPA: N-acetylmuramoyl-L-alanine amidase [Paenibacillus sp.]|uniref:N-acetylmuramoyl-L-alanine amidase family protein n=1 Tax=Paenibacillus TaxID=44249 RepID=UPI000B9FDAB2|nr:MULTISPECIES: N-acetylmuramoyl-L-alanine amidase [Paenibacillus]OZQ73336.1 N-acetylmuramoyl-L-alanine amidase [Paenibacillus taichungensis]HBU82144.1 N-acetylmuramoyl-L-alanine amidase [Paenibacillus sp.]
MRKAVLTVAFLLSAVLIVLLYSINLGDGAGSRSKTELNHQMIDLLSGNSNSPHQPGTLYKIVIDPGHGGKDRGATGAGGSFEKDFTLKLAHKVEEMAKQEPRIQVCLTRTDDRFISSVDRERPKFANDLGADLFISIHGNTYEDPGVSGTETYYYHENSRSLADIIQRQVVQASGFRDRGAKKQDYFVLKDTEMPAVLIETGYVTNPQEEKAMLTEDVQSRIAASILEGIKEYLNLN